MEALGCPGVRGGGWLDLMPLSRRTVDKYERLLRLHLEPELGSVELVDTWTKSRAWARSNARAACRRRAPRRTAQVPAGPLQFGGIRASAARSSFVASSPSLTVRPTKPRLTGSRRTASRAT